MKVEKTEITPSLNSYISVIRREENFFQAPFHYHPELELVYIIESYGKRIIGNSVENFEAGDMVFLGSNLPHVWLNDELYYNGISKLKAKCIVVYFNKEIFGPIFYELEQTSKIGTLFSNAERGLSIHGKTNESIAQKLEELTQKKDFDIIVGLFEILSILASSEEFTFINNEAYSFSNNQLKTDRLSEVYKYVKEHYMEDITLNEISKIANLSPPSFCRLFKSKTKKHFVEYLAEVRIAQSCKLIMETDMSIATIAYSCGYKTASNFNKIFKKVTGFTPMEYKKKTESFPGKGPK